MSLRQMTISLSCDRLERGRVGVAIYRADGDKRKRG